MRKFFFILCGVVLFGFINYGFIKWTQSGNGLADAWHALTQDWLLLITVVDACVFTLLVFAWLVADLKKRRLSRLQKALVLVAVTVTGASAFFIYLAFRPVQPSDDAV